MSLEAVKTQVQQWYDEVRGDIPVAETWDELEVLEAKSAVYERVLGLLDVAPVVAPPPYAVMSSVVRVGNSAWILCVIDSEGQGIEVGAFSDEETATTVSGLLLNMLVRAQQPQIEALSL